MLNKALIINEFTQIITYGTLYVTKPVFGRDIDRLSIVFVTHYFMSVNPYP